MKALFAVLTVLFCLSAEARDFAFSCTGYTRDNMQVTVSGAMDFRGGRLVPTTPLNVNRQIFNISGPTPEVEDPMVDFDFPRAQVRLRNSPEMFNVVARWGQAEVIIRHEQFSTQQSYIKVYLYPGVDHEFNYGSCEIQDDFFSDDF